MTRTQSFALAVLAVVASLIWLAVTWQFAARTSQWPTTFAAVTERGYDTNASRGRTGRPGVLMVNWRTHLEFVYDGVRVETTVDEYVLEDQVKIYVNPQNKQSVVVTPGVTLRRVGYPAIACVASLLFLIVLGLIFLSPKD